MNQRINANDLANKKESEASFEVLGRKRGRRKTSRVAIASIICAFIAIISVLMNIVFTFFNFYSIEEFFIATSILLSHAAFIFGILSIVIILFRRRELKGLLLSFWAIFMSLPFILIMVTGVFVGRMRAERMRTTRGQALSREIIAYSKEHEGYLPDAGMWCDLLMEHNKEMSKKVFRYPYSEPGICNYAFNRYLSGLNLENISQDVVLLFESEGPWNFAGTEELMKQANKNYKYVFVLSPNGTIQMHNFKYTQNRDLRWKP